MPIHTCKITACKHINRKHYAKGMCHVCWSASYYRGQREEIRKKHHDYFLSNRDNWTFGHLLRTYGLAKVDYYNKLEQQNWLCARCKEPFVYHGKMDPVCVDHDHNTDRIRGLLCKPCNNKVHDIEDLKLTFSYLREHDNASL